MSGAFLQVGDVSRFNLLSVAFVKCPCKSRWYLTTWSCLNGAYEKQESGYPPLMMKCYANDRGCERLGLLRVSMRNLSARF